MMRAFFNPFFDPEARFANADPAILQFHASLAGYRATTDRSIAWPACHDRCGDDCLLPPA